MANLGVVQKNYRRKSLKTALTNTVLYILALGKELSTETKSKRAVRNLMRYNFIYRTRDGNYCLTKKGEKRIRSLDIEKVKVKKRKHWDGKWYMVLYDFPVRYTKARNAFRYKLKELGFLQFQKSAWIYPYQCREEILFIGNFYGVGKYVQILEISKVLDDRKFKKHFGFF